MSNLSELLPAGAGAKSAEFVASGTLGSGVTVVLNSNGTVSTPLNQTESVSSPSTIQRGTHSAVLYDASQDCFIAFYQDLLGSSPLTYRVGTLSGTTITWTSATATSILSNNADIAIAGNNNGSFLVICEDSNQSSRQYGIAGTVSGTSITLGSTVEFTTSTYGVKGIAYDANASKYLLVYINNQNSLYLTGIVATVSGTSVSFGTAVTIDSNTYIYAAKAAYDSANQKVVAIGSRSNQVNGYVATISGTSFSTGSVATVSSSRPSVDGDTQVCNATYDANAGAVVFVYADDQNSERGTAIVGQVSGTSLTWGSTQVIDASDKFSYLAISYDSTAKKVVVSGDYGDGSHTGRYSVGTITGTSSSWASLVQFESGEPKNFASAFSTSDNKTAILYTDEGNSDTVTYVVQANAIQNYTDFIGITDQAIADTATGAVIVQGGVITNTGLIPVAAVSFGTASSPASQGMFNTRMAYDSTSNKIVLAYEDQSNSNYGTAVIGTISGTTISWGTPVVFNSASTADGSIDVVYDPDQNKSVIVYRDIGNSGYGTAIVGTVSGTTISFGSEVVFSTRSSYYINATYDTAQDKVLIVFADGTAPSYAYTGYMVVGTVSGSSISFGSEVQFESSTISGTALALQYDASASKSLIVYAVSSANYAASITISGTTPSIGTKNNWASTSARNTEAVYIASSSKCVFAYSTTATDSPSFSAVATIDSGTGNVTVAASSSIVSATAQNERGLAYDIGAGSLVYVYNATNNYMSVVLGSISGDSVTWGEPTVLDSSGYANANFPATVYNSTEEKTVIAYRNATDSQSVVTNITANTPLTPNTDYYVQADGTLSTTVSSVPAGRALSSTSILLEG